MIDSCNICYYAIMLQINFTFPFPAMAIQLIEALQNTGHRLQGRLQNFCV